MASSHSIRHTLLKHLFLNPHPQRRSAYQKARPRLYPNEGEFIRFLRTESEQEMVQHAKGILLDLVFSSSCPPPSHLILNLLQSQEEDRPAIERGGYIPRDHFVHLVHLYLLGIYIFANHENIFRRCSADLYRQRRTSANLPANAKLVTPYELFAVAWTQFVLYHDLGYPLEQIAPASRSRRIARLKPFTRVQKSIDKDLSFKAIARLVALRTLLAEEHHSTFEQAFLAQHPLVSIPPRGALSVLSTDADMSARFEVALEKWRHAIYLPNIVGPNDLRTVLSILPNVQICAFLEDPNGLGELALLGPANAPLYFCAPKNALPLPLRSFLTKQDALTAWSEARLPSVGYRWHYFAIDAKQEYDNLLKQIWDTKFQQFTTLADHIEREPGYRTLQAQGVDTSERLSALAYLWIEKNRGYIKYEDEEENAFTDIRGRFTALEKSREDVVSSLPGLISDVVAAATSDYVKKMGSSLVSLLDKSNSDAVARTVIQGLLEGKAGLSLSQKFSKSIQDNIVQPLALSAAVKECTNQLRENIDSHLSTFRPRCGDPLSGANIGETFSLADLLADPDFTAGLDQLLTRHGFPRFAQIVHDYSPARIERDKGAYPDSSKYCDHGFVSAIVALVAGYEYGACASLLKQELAKGDSVIEGLARLPFGARTSEDVESLYTDSKLLGTLVAETIALHNMYPSDLKMVTGAGKAKAPFKTRLGTQPFTFLALFVDALQKWDRQCLIDQTSSQVDLFTPGSRYDLEVGKDQMLHVRILDHRLNMGGVEKSLRTTLGAYLENADLLVKLTLEEK